MRQEDGQRCVGQDVASCSPEDQLPQAALCVGSLDQEIAILRCGRCQNRLTCGTTVEFNRERGRWDAVALQGPGQLFARWSGDPGSAGIVKTFTRSAC